MHEQKEKNRLSQSWLKENDPTSFNYSVYGEDDPSEKKKTTKKERCIGQYTKEKRKIINELGGKCNRCGITDTRVLDAHHIIPEWKTHKSNLQDLKINHRENNIEILCCNCHRIKGSGSVWSGGGF